MVSDNYNDIHGADHAWDDYRRTLAGSVADAVRIDSDEPAGMPGAAIDPASEDGRRIERLAGLLGGFSPADVSEALVLATQLDAHPAERAHWLERLGDAVGRFPGFEPLAFACVANATATFDAIGDTDGKRRCGAAMLAFQRDDAWMSYARKMIACGESRPGEQLSSIADCRAFAGLSEATLARLVQLAGTPHAYPRGDYLCVEGLRADKAFVLKSGRVAILQEVDRIETFLRFRHPGEVIGDMALLAGDRRRTASCMAIEPTEAWVLEYAGLRQLRDDPQRSDLRHLLERQYVERRIETRLLQHPLTCRLDIADRVQLGDLVDTGPAAALHLAAQQRLVDKAAAVEHVYFLLDGTVALTHPADGSVDATFTTTAKHAFFLGLPALFGNVHWPGDLIVRSEAWIARLPVTALRAFAASRPAFREAVAELLIASPSGRAVAA